ncbi:MAG TPA: hypothetical protein DCY53_04510 [Desulfobacteraceae bacterium]|nr:hypothetical protein [Desulfobacteraceae bacterium]
MAQDLKGAWMTTICQECEQFESRVKEWNRTYGAINPLPFIDGIIKPHRNLVFEGSTQDGAGISILSFQCLTCDQWWKVSAWGAIGTLDLMPQSPIYPSSRQIKSCNDFMKLPHR